ncbi:alanine racemase [Rhizobium sp. S152]|uniref:alanine racemase n=1 Tax=Rhizobium sp. S152 TaxID=3055038 RepID=UPI0025A9458E|nr:alanine racemase [Rhizobium sp. S152]MDM9627980.1 alanine racemase [Rhizobium sp. S152]
MNSSSINLTLANDGCGVLTIDLGSIAENYRRLSAEVSPATAAAVVKADAYGLGAVPVSQRLYQEGCRSFFVAHFLEAVQLRPSLPQDASIYVLNGLQPGHEERAAILDIVPLLNGMEQVMAWARAAVSQGRRLKAALQVDSGMSRLGLSGEEIAGLLAEPAIMAGIDLSLLVSHLACADEPENPANAEQLEALHEVSKRFPDLPISFANSGGVFLGGAFHGSLARPGIALYGGAPHAGGENPMRPVVRLHIPVIQTRTVPAGARVGYGGRLVADRTMRLATLAAGYADGIPRSLGDRGAVYFGGQRLPIAGRVSMDSMTVDISDLPEGTLTLGMLVEVIGDNQTLEVIADDADTISYEILTRLGRRYQRRYI